LLGILKRNLHPHLSRFYAHIDSLPSTKSAVAAYNNAQKQKIKARTTNASFELGLPNAKEGQVVTRLPPEPSGYLHIGHAKAAILNQYFAEHYKGTFLVRFDDTNPSKEKAEFQDSILEDLTLLGIKPDKLSYTSDSFDKLFQYAIELIKLGKAYTDDTLQAQMQKERWDGIASAHREDSVEANLEHFSLMQSGSEEGVKWCLRAKISVDDPNKAMRDPVIYRCNLQPHHRTGTTWKLYPGYDFACPVVDSIEGVTHALRTNEYHDRNPQYQWMLDSLKLRKVDIWDFGRISFVYTLLSKRKLKAMIEEKQLVSGWDDPRFPTVRGTFRCSLKIGPDSLW
jgi:glutamyl-tRNA synthetase